MAASRPLRRLAKIFVGKVLACRKRQFFDVFDAIFTRRA